MATVLIRRDHVLSMHNEKYPFVLNGKKYKSVYHYYEFHSALHLGHTAILSHINPSGEWWHRESFLGYYADPHERLEEHKMNMQSQSVRHRYYLETIRPIMLYTAIKEYVMQNHQVANYLYASGNKDIIMLNEGNDMGETTMYAYEANRYGKVLEQIRSELV